jgi:hypothetical protein
MSNLYSFKNGVLQPESEETFVPDTAEVFWDVDTWERERSQTVGNMVI